MMDVLDVPFYPSPFIRLSPSIRQIEYESSKRDNLGRSLPWQQQLSTRCLTRLSTCRLNSRLIWSMWFADDSPNGVGSRSPPTHARPALSLPPAKLARRRQM